MKKQRINIGIITPRASGAGDVFLADLAKLLHAFSGEVHIVAGDTAHKSGEGTISYSIRMWKESGPFLQIINHIRVQVEASLKLATLGKKVDIWVFFLGGEALLLPMLTAKLLRRRVVLALAGSMEQEGQIKKNKLYMPLRAFKKINCTLADTILVYSPRIIKEWNLEEYKHKIIVSQHHYLDLDTFRIQKPCRERKNIVGYIGRLSKEKGITDLLDGIASFLSENEHSIKFLIIGDGPLRSQVEKRINHPDIAGKIELVGWVEHTDIPKLLNEMKLLVLPSYTEGLPMTLIEAIACGTPIIATSVGSIPDVIEDGQTGFVIKDNSPQSIAMALTRALNHPNLEGIAQQARALAEKEYTFDAAVYRYKYALSLLSDQDGSTTN